MSRFVALLKMNLRLLLRNKAFLFFLCITPILAVCILNLKTDSTLYEEKAKGSSVIELENCKQKAIYVGNTSAFIVKVYDASHTALSDYILEELTSTGLFSVCRCDVSNMTEDEVLTQIKADAYNDRAGAFIYFLKNFDAYVLDGNYKEALLVYDVSDDERWELFATELTELLSQLHQFSESAGMESGQILETMHSIHKAFPQKNVVNFQGKEDIVLNPEQSTHRDHIGYALAIITLGFLFCGVFVAHTVIEEQDKKVYTRMMLSKLSMTEYLCSKLTITIIISILQAFVLGITMFIAKDMDFGIPKMSFLFIIFLLGLIFSILSFVIGVLVGDVMSSNYAVFCVWSISALLSGMYFPIGDSSAILKAISYLMPQRWFLKASEMLFVGDSGVYSMVLYVTVGYMIIIMSIGSVGLKIRSRE